MNFLKSRNIFRRMNGEVEESEFVWKIRKHNSSSFQQGDELYFGGWFLQRTEYCIDDGLTRIYTMMNFMMAVCQH